MVSEQEKIGGPIGCKKHPKSRHALELCDNKFSFCLECVAEAMMKGMKLENLNEDGKRKAKNLAGTKTVPTENKVTTPM